MFGLIIGFLIIGIGEEGVLNQFFSHLNAGEVVFQELGFKGVEQHRGLRALKLGLFRCKETSFYKDEGRLVLLVNTFYLGGSMSKKIEIVNHL